MDKKKATTNYIVKFHCIDCDREFPVSIGPWGIKQGTVCCIYCGSYTCE